jgi:hypothetical protein
MDSGSREAKGWGQFDSAAGTVGAFYGRQASLSDQAKLDRDQDSLRLSGVGIEALGAVGNGGPVQQRMA